MIETLSKENERKNKEIGNTQKLVSFDRIILVIPLPLDRCHPCLDEKLDR